jgi:hypothetical protein
MAQFLIISHLFRISSAVEQRTVNPLVAGSNPASGVFSPSIEGFFYGFFFANLLYNTSIKIFNLKEDFMSIEAVDNADSIGAEKIDFFDQQNDSEKAKESQGRVNHGRHFYGSSIEQCKAVLPMNEARDTQVNIVRDGLPFLTSTSDKDFTSTLLLCILLGGLGVHRFYVDKPLTGLLQLVTFGGLGIWTLVDLVMIANGNFEDGEGRLIKAK